MFDRKKKSNQNVIIISSFNSLTWIKKLILKIATVNIFIIFKLLLFYKLEKNISLK